MSHWAHSQACLTSHEEEDPSDEPELEEEESESEDEHMLVRHPAAEGAVTLKLTLPYQTVI